MRRPPLASMVLSWGACRAAPDLPTASPASSARLPDRPMTLAVTPIAPGEVAGFRIVGGLASTDVTILRGTAGQQSCPPPLNGACVDLGKAKALGTATTDVDGALLLELTIPDTVPVGHHLAFQALTTDTNGNSYVSNVVGRRAIKPAAYEAVPATNILLLLLDDVGVDRFALYGAPFPATTPVIDALAADGVLFENAWAMPWCAPTRASLQTGRYPRRTGFGDNPNIGHSSIELDPNLVTLAELVEHSPFVTYATSFMGKWHLAAYDSAASTLGPVVQGWDWWSGSMANLTLWDGPDPGVPVGYYDWQKVDSTGVVVETTDYATTDTVDDAIDRVAAMSEPWMLEVAFNAAHTPYNLPPADLHTNAGLTESSPKSDKHRALLEAADTEIGRLLASISIDVLDRTTIFVVGDNGTPPGALEGEDADPQESKGTLWDGGIRVPFIVAGPLVGSPGSVSTTFASVVDIFPTVAEIAGVDTAILRGSLDPFSPVVLDGVSLVPALEDPAAPTGRTLLYAESFTPGGAGPFYEDHRAIRNATHKFIIEAVCGHEELFEYVAGSEDEGDDLLAAGALTADQQAALDDLRAQITTLVDGLTYDAVTFPESPATGGCPGDTGDTGP